MGPQDISEDVLIRRAQDGDELALGALYERHVDAIYHFMLYRTSDHQIAEDLTAEVFMNMITSIHRYRDMGVPFSAWLFRIARSRLIDHWRRSKRRQKRQVSLSEEMEEFISAATDNPAERFEHEELVKSLEYLTDAEREIILLRFVGGLSNQEIALVVKSNSNAVKSMMYRSLKKLRRILNQKAEFFQDYIASD
jgi:RNA polymerase sigma-70 factor (ECF subfamily)